MYCVGDKVKLNRFWRKSTTKTYDYCIVEDRTPPVMTVKKIGKSMGINIYYTDYWIAPDYMLIPERSLGNVIRNRRKSVS